MGTGFSKKKKQSRMLHEQFNQLQDQLKKTEATGNAGNGLVSITLNGEHEMKHISIKPDCIDPEDVEGLQDLIKAAYNDAKNKINAQSPNMPQMPKGMPDFGMLGL